MLYMFLCSLNDSIDSVDRDTLKKNKSQLTCVGLFDSSPLSKGACF